MIAEAERGEDAAKKAYRDALAKDLPADLHDMIQEQYSTVLDTHNKVRALELQQTA
ncbi:PA2169 family four-helix-bundle protein [Nevskia soli]|uniref:PA2169 family four-helix-bundle protein n=1 Tax=Nevskia soli TaxID=418856 RepID=UPI00345FFA76